MKTFAALVCFAVFGIPACNGAEFDLGAHGLLFVAMPDGWTVNAGPAASPDGRSIGYALSFKTTNAANAKCSLTFAYVSNCTTEKTAIRTEVSKMCEQFVSGSAEKKVVLRDFQLQRGFGAYCVLTDASLTGRKAKPGEYYVMGSGQIRLNEDMVGVVSLFADDATGNEFRAMLNIINSLKVMARGPT